MSPSFAVIDGSAPEAGSLRPKAEVFLAANTWPKIFIDLFAFAVIKDVRDMIAELEGNAHFFQLFGNRDQSNVADFQTAIFFWHIEVPQPFDCSLFSSSSIIAT